MQRLDLGQHTLEQRSQLGAVGLVARELLREPRERVPDRGQPRGVEPPDLLAEGVQSRQQLLGKPAGRRDVVGVTVASPLGGARGQARIVVALDRAPAVQRCEALLEPVDVDAERIALAQPVGDLCRSQPQSEGLMLDVQHAHDAAVRLRLLGDRVADDLVGAETIRRRVRRRALRARRSIDGSRELESGAQQPR